VAEPEVQVLLNDDKQQRNDGKRNLHQFHSLLLTAQRTKTPSGCGAIAQTDGSQDDSERQGRSRERTHEKSNAKPRDLMEVLQGSTEPRRHCKRSDPNRKPYAVQSDNGGAYALQYGEQ
jgi:hypothetical protein